MSAPKGYEKVRTPGLRLGDVVLITADDETNRWSVAHRLRDADHGVVTYVEVVPGHRQRRYAIHFPVGVVVRDVVPGQTWLRAIDADLSGSASRQHYIDTGRYLLRHEVEANA